ncbi:MAG: Asp-tRNA(Asn)/Glu-tRNA(Gln) amidotransferase subunit GatB [Paracoccaceae bacterium]
MPEKNYTEPEPKRYHGIENDWELVVGMEVHAQVVSESKLFSGSSTKFGVEPNRNVSFVDAAMPGMLPVVNQFCIRQAVKTGLGLKAKINKFSRFDRKNYFYPDLPQGYQISQLYHPIVGNGEVIIELESERKRKIRIERIHLEQDAGKSIHDMDPELSFVDLNRSGVALMEIVSFPDIRSAEEAAAYLRKLRQIMLYLGTCDGNMQEGSLRADVNVSVCLAGNYEKFRKTGDLKNLGTRCEIKNMNSLKFLQQAIDFEARRQIALLEDGNKVIQETRLFDPNAGETKSMRSKEEAHDYRYFPCPDLLPIEITESWIDEIKDTLPELPDQKKQRLIKQYSINDYDASIIISEPSISDYFESVAENVNGKNAANLFINELFGRLNKSNLQLSESPISSKQFNDICGLIDRGVISSKIAKDIFDILWTKGGNPEELVKSLGLAQLTDEIQLDSIVEKIIENNPNQVKKVKENPKLKSWFVGQAMKETKGKANPKILSGIVEKLLG